MQIVNKKIRETVYLKYDRHCAYCGCEINFKRYQEPAWLEVDHLTPQSNKGHDIIDNLMPACRLCNNTKGSMSLEEFRKRILFLSRSGLSCQYPEDWDGKFYFEN